jgi:hypothetical protein
VGALAELYAAHPFWSWAGLGAALLAVEVTTGSGWLLWAAASALATAAACTAFALPAPTALLVYALLTIASTLLARRYLPQRAQAGQADFNDMAQRLMGARGLAAGPFAGRAGRVMVDGKEWAAELEGGGPLAAGADIEVTGVHGARLTVRRA